MFATKTTKSPDGEVTTRHLEGSIVETSYRGVCTRALVQSVLEITPEVLDSVPGTLWLVDLSSITSSEAMARIPGADLLKIFRERGGAEFAVSISSAALRMIFTAIAFAAPVPLKLFATREEALAHLRSRPAAQRAR
jgi:hypothetical protein